MHIIKISFWRNKICCYLHYGKEAYPFPTFGNFKWQFIIDAAFNSIDLLIIRIIGKAQDSNLCVSRYRNKTVKWILSALPFFFFLKLKNFQNCIPKQPCGFLLVQGLSKSFVKQLSSGSISGNRTKSIF